MKLKQPLEDDTTARRGANRFRREGSDRLPLAGPPVRMGRHSMRLGERLIAAGWVKPDQIEAALEVKRRSGGFLGETMLEMGVITEAHDALDALRADPSYTTEQRSVRASTADVDDAPVVRLANSILHGAIGAEASDVHLEPQEAGLRVRYRVDGMLQEHMIVPRAQQAAVLSRIKIMGDMDIAETRRPQDGRA